MSVNETTKLLDGITPQQFSQLIYEAEKRGLVSRKKDTLTINELSRKAHANARAHGFWDDWDQIDSLPAGFDKDRWRDSAISTRLLLIISEVTEALEALRRGDRPAFREEISDTFIRLGDLCGGLGIDAELGILGKMRINEGRPHKHGKRF